MDTTGATDNYQKNTPIALNRLDGKIMTHLRLEQNQHKHLLYKQPAEHKRRKHSDLKRRFCRQETETTRYNCGSRYSIEREGNTEKQKQQGHIEKTLCIHESCFASPRFATKVLP